MAQLVDDDRKNVLRFCVKKRKRSHSSRPNNYTSLLHEQRENGPCYFSKDTTYFYSKLRGKISSSYINYYTLFYSAIT